MSEKAEKQAKEKLEKWLREVGLNEEANDIPGSENSEIDVKGGDSE